MYSKLLLNKKKIMFILAIGAGALLSSPSVHALPEQEGYVTPGVSINIITAEESMNITGSDNNVINWSSFNVGDNETVKYDKNNYLNLIHDTEASQINGKITGGKNIYLINPNGVLFGDNSSVNVGNLYISTRALEDVDALNFETKGINPLSTSATNYFGDIVNLGTMQANQVVLEGNNVTLKNDADIIVTNNNVTINAVNAIEIGKKADAADLANNWTHNIDIMKFNLISDYDDLKAARYNPNANYMLACDIDASPSKNENEGNGFAYIGTYNGIFNGLNHEIKNLYINKGQASGHDASHVGLFGNIGCSSVVKNLNMVGCEIHGVEDVAAITGYIINGGKVINCSTDNSCKIYGTEFVGGIAGTTKGGSIVDCVNNAYVDGWNCVGGIVGIADGGNFTLDNSINNGNVFCHDDPTFSKYGRDWRYENAHVGGLIGCAGDGQYPCRITNSTNYGTVAGPQYVGGIAGSFNGGSIDGCENNAAINGTSYIGGIIGACIGGLDYTLVFGNTNNADVNGTESVGGIAGLFLAGSVQGNTCKAKVTGDYNVGNIVGSNWGGDDDLSEYNKYIDPSTLSDPATQTRDKTRSGNDTLFGDEAQSVNDAILGDEAQSSNNTMPETEMQSGNDTPLGDETQSGNDAPLRDEAQSGNDAPLGDEAQSGNDAPLGDEAQSGNDTLLGTETQFGNDTPTTPSNKPKQTQPMIDNAIYDGLMAADCLKPLISNDFQNFSKGTTLVGETIQATKDDEETVSSRKKLILKE